MHRLELSSKAPAGFEMYKQRDARDVVRLSLSGQLNVAVPLGLAKVQRRGYGATSMLKNAPKQWIRSRL